jgi:TP901 family phage tail tape measure protein
MANNFRKNAEVTVTLNGEAANNMLKMIAERAKAVGDQIREIAKKGAEATDEERKKLAALQKDHKTLEATQKNVTKATYDYSNVLKNLNGSTLRELEKAKKALRAQLQHLTPETQKYINTAKQVQQVDSRIRQLNGALREQQSGWSRLATTFNRYATMLGVSIASFTGIIAGLKKAKEEAAKMDDAYADVMKTTGMTKDEVLQLNEAFKKMNTRTGREELNMLARDAGKLGVAKKDVLGFVEAGNMINVALGEDLGDDAIKNIGKIISVFEKGQKDLQQMDLKGQMLAVGSAINTLGQSSTASEQFLVEFTQRMGGMGSQAGMTIQNVLGFASALDQAGVKAEMSATALSKVIMKIMAEPAEFAKIAGKDIKEFSELIDKDINHALISVFQAMGDKGGLKKLVPIFQEVGLDAARSAEVVSSLSTNIGKVVEAQEIANRAFADGTSVINEYNIKNETLQAKLDKARQRMKDLSEELGRKFQGPMFSAISLWNNLLALIVNMPKGIYILIGSMAALTVIVKSATVAKKAWIAVTKTWHSVAVTGRTVTLLWAAATNAFAGNTAKAKQAWKLFNASFSKTAIGAVITIIAALGMALYKLVTYVDPVTKAVREFNKELAIEELQAKRLFDAYKKTNEGTEERRRILDEIKSKYGQYLTDLINEKGEIDNIDLALQRVNTSLREQIALKMKNAVAEDLIKSSIERQQKYIEKIRGKIKGQEGSAVANVVIDEMKRIVEENKNDMASAEKAVKELLGRFNLTKETKVAGRTFTDINKDIRMAVLGYTSAVYELNMNLNNLEETFGGFISKKEDSSDMHPSRADFKPQKGDSTVQPLSDEEIKNRLASLELLQSKEKLLLANQRKDNLIEAKAYTKALEVLDIKYYEKKRDLYPKDSEEYIKYQQKIVDAQIKQTDEQKKHDDEILKKREDYFAALEKVSADYEKSIAEKEEAELIAIRQKYDKAKELAQKANDEKLISDIEYLDNVTSLTIQMQNELDDKEKEQRKKREEKKRKAEEDFEKERLEALKKYELMSVSEMYQEELRLLNELHEKKLDAQGKLIRDQLITDEEYKQALLAMNERYGDLQEDQFEKEFDKRTKGLRKYLAKAEMITKVASNAVSAIQDAELARSDANKEKELSALLQQKEQGLITEEQYAAQKQQIEDDAARERIDIQAKYADANFALQASQAVITGIVSAMEAYKALAGIPYVGPALGAAAVAVVAITTAAQIAQLNAEREKAKSISYNSPGSSSSASTSQRVVLPGREEGGYVEAEREQDGKRFRARRRRQRGYVEEPTVLTGEAGAEFVANAGAVANPTVRPVLDMIDIAQRNGSIGSINLPELIRVAGYEQGGYTAPTAAAAPAESAAQPAAAATDKALIAMIAETRDLLRHLKTNGVKAPVVVTEFEKKQALLAKSRAIGTRNS